MSNTVNIFVTLPHIILNHIIKKLENIDRIVLSLVCRRFFYERDKYFVFNTKNISKRVNYQENNKLRNYQEQLAYSINNKSQCSVRIYTKGLGFSHPDIDYNLNYDDIDSYKYLDETITKLEILSTNVNINEELSKSHLEYLKISPHSDSTCFNYLPKTLKKLEINTKSDITHLPPTLEILILGVLYNSPIAPLVLPNSLKSISFGANFNQPINLDTFPPSLKKISFGYMFNHPIGVGVIPSGVTKLSFDASFSHTFTVGSLPHSLKSLKLGASIELPLKSDDVLPPFLETIHQMPVSWLPLLRSHPSIRSIILKNSDGDDIFYMQSSDYPPTLTNLDFGLNNFMLKYGSLPCKLNSLKIGRSSFKLNEQLSIFSNDSEYGTLNMSAYYFTSSFPRNCLPKIKKLVLPSFFNEKLEQGSLPVGLEEIEFGYSYDHDIEIGVIPSTVTKIIFGLLFKRVDNLNSVLPDGVRSITFGNLSSSISALSIPSSVKKLKFLTLPSDSISQSIPTTVTNIRIVYYEEINTVILKCRRLNDFNFLIIKNYFKNAEGYITNKILPL